MGFFFLEYTYHAVVPFLDQLPQHATTAPLQEANICWVTLTVQVLKAQATSADEGDYGGGGSKAVYWQFLIFNQRKIHREQ